MHYCESAQLNFCLLSLLALCVFELPASFAVRVLTAVVVFCQLSLNSISQWWDEDNDCKTKTVTFRLQDFINQKWCTEDSYLILSVINFVKPTIICRVPLIVLCVAFLFLFMYLSLFFANTWWWNKAVYN